MSIEEIRKNLQHVGGELHQLGFEASEMCNDDYANELAKARDKVSDALDILHDL